jgi:putative oxidoreductase
LPSLYYLAGLALRKPKKIQIPMTLDEWLSGLWHLPHTPLAVKKRTAGSFTESGVVMVRLSAAYTHAIDAWRQVSLPVLRVALGIIYIWFGAEKVGGVSPVASLVRNTVPFVTPPQLFVPVVGMFEVAIGIWLISGIGLRVMLPLFVLHMLGTFGVLVVQPSVAFQHGNPFLLTATGEFVIKNLVLLSAGLAVVCWQTSRSLATQTDRETALGPVMSPIVTPDPAAIIAPQEI